METDTAAFARMSMVSCVGVYCGANFQWRTLNTRLNQPGVYRRVPRWHTAASADDGPTKPLLSSGRT